MSTITKGTVDPSVQDLTHDLYTLGFLEHYDVQAEYTDRVAAAVGRFQSEYMHIPPTGQCDEETHRWIHHYAEQAPNRAAVGTWRIVDDDGTVLASDVHVEPVQLAGDTTEIPRLVFEILMAAAEGPACEALKAPAAAFGMTIAVGLEFATAALLGVSAGVGIYVPPDGELGFYLSFEGDFGWVFGGSIAGKVAAVKGGPDNFKGAFKTVNVDAFVGIGVGGTLLYGADDTFAGLAAKVGLGVDIGLYGGVSYTRLVRPDS